jgi:hypothetical protein
VWVSDSTLYTALGDTLRERDHSDGSVQWSNTLVDGYSIMDSHAASQDYLYASVSDGSFHRLYKANGTATTFSFDPEGTANDIDTDGEGYVYLNEGSNLTIVDPADGSEVFTYDFGNGINTIRVRSDGVYVESGLTLSKVQIHDLP